MDEISTTIQERTGSICLLRIGSCMFMYRNPTLPQTALSISPHDEEKRELVLIEQTLALEGDFRAKQKNEKRIQRQIRKEEMRKNRAEKQREKRRKAADVKRKEQEQVMSKRHHGRPTSHHCGGPCGATMS
eukprot:TRINITY_DN38084_c0_g1_i11.p1 TRINITY_DN38084_c0_g1~~TRINITY_DN38084_c0_g1_i11.p1  ORF type:complete len:131 (-),score=13.50 TRINITY_DN38084_c0_g1_i11:43-435(-)